MEAFALIVDGAHGESFGQAGMKFAGEGAGAQFDQRIVGCERLDDAWRPQALVLLGAYQPVALVGGIGEVVEVFVVGETSIHNHQ